MKPDHKGLCKPCWDGELDPKGIGKSLKRLQEEVKSSDLHPEITVATGCVLGQSSSILNLTP